MKKIYALLTALICLAVFTGGVSAAGEDTGYIQVYSNVNGALVKLIDGSGNVVQTGYISNGQATFTVYTTGTPIRTVEVSASGCTTETSSVSMPSADGTSTVTVDLSMIPVPSPSPLPVFGLIAGLCAAVYLLRR
ncbi:MAG: hypothetical protein Q4Q53_02525 [Methanocorpusculum sp.]|nr:hypothetical protein [Methanocorpusculum sp.]